MARYLAGEKQTTDRPVALFDGINLAYFAETPRQCISELRAAERVESFDEVRLGFTKEEAVPEAERCFHCGRCTLCENCYIYCSGIAVNLDAVASSPVFARALCEGCGVCIHECPRGALSWGRRGTWLR